MNTAPSPSEMDNRAQEDGSTGLGTSTPPAEADEPGRNITTDGQREKRDVRERLPAPVPPQPKLNGGQQPPAGVPTHFDPAFRSMMPPYVSHSVILWIDLMGVSQLQYPVVVIVLSLPCIMTGMFCVSRCSMPILKCLLPLDKVTSDTLSHKMEQSEFTSMTMAKP